MKMKKKKKFLPKVVLMQWSSLNLQMKPKKERIKKKKKE